MKLQEILEDKTNRERGFTLPELLLTIGISLVLVVVAVPVFGNLLVTNQLIEAEDRLRQALRVAYTRSFSGLNNSAHGVYIDINIGSEDAIIMYQGDSYVARDVAYDLVEEFDEIMFLSSTISGNDINFARATALPSATGTITIHHSVEGQSVTTITDLGMVRNQ